MGSPCFFILLPTPAWVCGLQFNLFSMLVFLISQLHSVNLFYPLPYAYSTSLAIFILKFLHSPTFQRTLHSRVKQVSQFITRIGLFCLFFTYFPFWKFFFLTYYIQDFARRFNILLKVNKLYSYVASSLTVTSYTLYTSTA